MKISAHNVMKGKVKSITKSKTDAEVTLQVAPGVDIVSSIALPALKMLGLKKGAEAYAIIQSSDVMVGTPHSKK